MLALSGLWGDVAGTWEGWIEEVHESRVRGKVRVYQFFTGSESQKCTRYRPRGYIRASISGILVHLEVLDKENLVTLRGSSL